MDDPNVGVLQVAASLLALRLLRQGFFPRARELGRTVYVRSIFLQGMAHLARGLLLSFLADLVEPIRQIRTVADQLGVTARALYLAFAREYLPGVHPVVGCETRAQLDELLADWQSDTVDVAKLAFLVEALPTHAAELVDPSRWPSIEDTPKRPGNQTDRPSIATMPG
ncbi:MAG: hypothetical protein GY910_03560 [bacterium]|nr:hypothetical protein [Deltaproteobacteria bacterium]MCP4904035.1 hypothetical protein [bacterium]